MDNFDWVKDLEELLGNAADYIPGVSSLDELSRGDLGGAATAPFASLGALWSLGQATVKSDIGSQVAKSNAAWAFLSGNEEEYLRNKAMINPPTGERFMPHTGPRVDPGREKWEQVVPEMPGIIQAGLELVTDPTNLITPGMSAGAAAGLREAATVGGPIARRLLPAAARGVESINMLNNTIPDQIMAGTVGRGVRAGRGAVERRFPHLLEDAPKTRVIKKTRELSDAFSEVLSARGQQYRGMVPAVMPERGKSLAPLETYPDVPPFYDRAFDRGVPASLKQKAFEAHQRLARDYQSFPGIPGVTEPGLSPAQPGQATFMQGQRPGDSGQGIMGRIRSSLSSGPLGIYNIPQGGFQTPQDLKGLSDDQIQEMLHDMATMGATWMTEFDNDISNDMFRAITRTEHGMPGVRDELVGYFGPGAEHLIPGSYDEMRSIYGDKLPDIRYLTSFGWSDANGEGTKRLARLQERVNEGLPLDDAYDEILKGMSKGSPQAVEHASAAGAGRMMADMTDTTPGLFPPQGIDQLTKRAEVPEGFANRFAANRESYAKYMRQLFGNDINEQEMEVLRKMSTEILYDEYVNAAGELSGGAGGATRILRSGQNPENYLSSEGRTKTEHTKIGIYPGDDPSHIANRLEDVRRLNPRTKAGQKPTLRTLNAAEYKELTGQTAPRGWSTEKVFQEVKNAGGTGFSLNPRGGPLPSVQALLDMHDVGKNILVGGKDASQFYRDAVDEVMDIVGPGRYEDAMMLIELMAVTSSGTGVGNNAENALRAFAEWKLGSDDMIRNGLGLTEDQVETLLNRSNRWKGVRQMLDTVDPKTGSKKRWSQIAPEPQDDLLMGAMAANQRAEAGRLFETYVQRREAREAGEAATAFDATQGGPKTNQFAGSFLVKLWKDSLDYALPEGPAKQKVMDALDRAMQVYTIDRHETRVANQATAVTPLGYDVQREHRLIMAKELPDVRPEDIQSSIWYYSKSRQGYLQVRRDDDMASMLRQAWNKKQDPATRADIREKIRSEMPGIDDFDLEAVADDLMRQEAVIAIVKDSMNDISISGKPKLDRAGNIIPTTEGQSRYRGSVQAILGTDNPVAQLFDIGNDTLGIVSRTQQGIVPRRSVSTSIPELVTSAEKQLQAIRSGSSYGSTWRWDGDSWVPSTDATGFAVALDSAGTVVRTAKPKTSARDIEVFLGKYADLLDEPGASENIKFGTRLFDNDPERASFDLTIVVPDEATATRIGRATNQKAIYDIAAGRSIDVGGTGVPASLAPDDVRGIIESVFGPAQSPRESINVVRRRGATIHELDSVNPVSILMRRVIKPIMDGYAEESARVLPKKPKVLQTTGGGVMEPSWAGTEPVDFEALGQEPLVSTQANTIINQVADETGETYKTRMLRYYDEATDDFGYVDSTGKHWGSDLSLEERLDAAGDDERLKDIIRKYDKENIDIGYSDPRSITLSRVRKEIGKQEGVETETYSTWDLLRAAWGEQILLTPKYLLGNMQGAWIQNAFGGHFHVGTPTEFLSAFKLERGGFNTIEREDILKNLVGYQMGRKWGFEDLPSYIQQGGIRSRTSVGNRSSGSAMGELTAKVTRNRRLGRTVGKPFRYQADMSQAIETVVRSSLWGDTIDREMSSAMSVLEDSINAMAQRQGLDEFEFSVLRGINPVPGGPSPKRLKEHLMTLGFSEGYAERAGRNFAEAKNIAERVAHAEVDKRQFSYDRTNLDEFVGKFIPFHYWYSRALKYYAEETLRHPIVITSYMRFNQGIEDAQDNPGLSARQKGFLRIMGTPLGFSLLMNPDALMGVVRVFGLDQTYTPDGQTEAGGVVNWLKDRGMGLYPWIDGTLNLMGVYGDTIEPDMLGIRHKALIGSVVNTVAAYAGMEPPGSPYADLMGELRYRVSSVVSDFTPDWLSQTVLPKAGGSQQDATLDTIIESRVMARNPGINNGQLLEIITDPENPEYIAAYQDAATAGLIQQLVNITTPVSVRMREDSRDVRNAKISTTFDAAKEAGVTPQEFTPSMGDVDFAARYKNLTGSDWKAGDFDKAMAESDLTKATPQAKPFVYEEQLYNNLGTPEERQIFQRYQDLRYGDAPETRILPEDQRTEIAEMWVDAKGYRSAVSDIYQLRDAFEKTHSEFAEFKAWQGQMYNLKANLGGSLSEYRRQAIAQNPNAAEYFRKVIEDMKATKPSSEWTSILDDKTANAEAWQSITGRTKNRQDAAPVPGAIPFDTTLPQMQQPFEDQYSSNPYPFIGNVANSYGYSGY